jgi:hypothetical protein
MRIAHFIATAAVLLPSHALAQARVLGDLEVERNERWATGGAQVMQRSQDNPQRPLASQFDSLGTRPLGAVGDTVTIYYFADGANLTSSRHSRIIRRDRFFPPRSWRNACDEIAHPGWLYRLDAPGTSNFAVVVPGARQMPNWREPSTTSRGAARHAFTEWADSTWQRWREALSPLTEREEATRWYRFYGDSLDAGWHKIRALEITGPEGRPLTVFSAWLNDDHQDGTPNTAATWVVNSWGYVVARSAGHIDIYGATDVDSDGIQEVVSSRGVIRWNGSTWLFPKIYSEEPCLMRQVMGPPPGRDNSSLPNR